MGEYVPEAPVDDEARKRNGNLPGMGGVFNYVNLHVYHYAGNNPVRYVDPDGRSPVLDEEGNLLGTTGENEWAGVPIIMNKDDYQSEMSEDDALNKGIRLNKYGEGIKITNDTWNTIEYNGGDKRLRPYVVNNSKETVYYKPEGMMNNENMNPNYDASGAYDVEAGKDLYARVDGVKTSSTHPNKVYRIPNNSRVTINERGRPRGNSIFHVLFFIYGNVKAPYSSWHELRDKFK